MLDIICNLMLSYTKKNLKNVAVVQDKISKNVKVRYHRSHEAAKLDYLNFSCDGLLKAFQIIPHIGLLSVYMHRALWLKCQTATKPAPDNLIKIATGGRNTYLSQHKLKVVLNSKTKQM